MTQEQLTDQLRHQAARFDPQPPPTLRRRVATALADAPPPRGAARPHYFWFALTGAVLACAAVVVTLIVRAPQPTHPSIAQRPPTQHTDPVLAATPSRPSPLALAQEWIDDPLEGEVQNLWIDLKTASQTVSSVLPSPVKRARATTSNATL